MNKIMFLFLVFGLLFAAAAVSGCTNSTITNQEQASGAITNISNDVQDVASTLEDISKSLD